MSAFFIVEGLDYSCLALEFVNCSESIIESRNQTWHTLFNFLVEHHHLILNIFNLILSIYNIRSYSQKILSHNSLLIFWEWLRTLFFSYLNFFLFINFIYSLFLSFLTLFFLYLLLLGLDLFLILYHFLILLILLFLNVLWRLGYCSLL